MYIALVVLHALVCFAIIGIVLLQAGKGADIGSAFGGGGSQAVFGSMGTPTILGKITTAVAILFMITSFSLAKMSSQVKSVVPATATRAGRPGRARRRPARRRHPRPRRSRGRRSGRMRGTKLLLLAAPTLVGLFLLQSYFWVPTFENQARGDPGRLTRFISTSIADAVILNPTISADSASSEVNALVFEGLIDRDLDLSFRGRLAESWQVSEEAYLFADETVRLPDGAAATPETLLARLRAAQAAGSPALRAVEAMTVLPAETSTVPMRAAGRRAAPRRARPDASSADARRHPAPAAYQVHPARRGPGLLREPRPAAGRVPGPARPSPIRDGAGPRDGPGGRRGARPADGGEPGHRLPAPARRALPRRARAHREGRALHLRDHHGSAEPLAPGAGLRADQGGRDPGSLHGPGDVQGALPAGLRELGHGDPARAPPQPRGARRRGARGRQGPRDLQRAGRRVQPATGGQRAVPVRLVGKRRLDPARSGTRTTGRGRRTSGSTSCGSSRTP